MFDAQHSETHVLQRHTDSSSISVVLGNCRNVFLRTSPAYKQTWGNVTPSTQMQSTPCIPDMQVHVQTVAPHTPHNTPRATHPALHKSANNTAPRTPHPTPHIPYDIVFKEKMF